MGLKRIFVHRSVVDRNHKSGKSDPVFTVIDSDGGEHVTSNIIILGPCEIKYSREGGKGMRVWIETFDKIVMKDGTDTETGSPVMVSV